MLFEIVLLFFFLYKSHVTLNYSTNSCLAFLHIIDKLIKPFYIETIFITEVDNFSIYYIADLRFILLFSCGLWSQHTFI